MENTEFLDFDEAVQYLKTNSSTLYKWLQSGKVPGHKLGRQWRFLREELEMHVSGKSGKIQTQTEALAFAELLNSRSKKTKEKKMNVQIRQLAENLIWDAFDHGANLIHISPSKGKFEVVYRSEGKLKALTTFQEEFFQQLDGLLHETSAALSAPNARRIYLQRSDEESLQVRYQKVETVTGPRVTLQLLQPQKEIHPFEGIAGGDQNVITAFKKWSEETHGIIVVAGLPGSGKTTTMYSFLNELQNQERVVFSIEGQVGVVIEGIHQVELTKKSVESFEEAFAQVYSSDPDVIGLSLGATVGLENSVFTNAFNAANSGHLVILQLGHSSVDEVLKDLSQHLPAEFKKLLIGISVQKLVVTPAGARKAVYTLKDFRE